MTIVIIEDEPLTARDLAACVRVAEPTVEIVASLASVGEAKDWFDRHAAPDLIFSDIQLGDGQAFVVFERLMQMVPVIFCTAYDEYALEAFRAAGIDYILKPFTEKSVGAALAKYKALRGADQTGMEVAGGKMAEPAAAGRKMVGPVAAGGKMAGPAGAILVFYKEKILPVKVGDIAFFYLEKEVVRLVGFDHREYMVNKSLEELEGLVGSAFYRVNRQFLVNRTAIKDVSQYFGRKLLLNLSLPFGEKITVGRLKVPDFLHWLAGS